MTKQIYHSALSEPTTVVVKSGQQESKFRAGEKYIILNVDNVDRFLTIDHPRVADALAPYKGQRITIRATGRGESADIEILSGNGARGEPATGSTPQPPRTSSTETRDHPPFETPAQDIREQGAWQERAEINPGISRQPSFDSEAWFKDYVALVVRAGQAHESIYSADIIEKLTHAEYAALNQTAALECLREKRSYKYWDK
jgi:hypothetical protein